jgi:DNA invertase Pin-like site-specific DNA recombinase
MARVGYARVSTTDQDLSAQVERLKAAGCEIIRSEKVTGTTRTRRSELASIIEFLRPGDELVVTRIDRLARSIADLQDIVRELKRKGAFLRAADQPIDTSTAAGKAFLDTLGSSPSLKPTCGAKGSWRGLRGPKGDGVYRGGKRRIDREAVWKLRTAGKGPTEISQALGISRMHVYRILSELRRAAQASRVW